MNQRECLDAIRKLQFFAIDLNLYLVQLIFKILTLGLILLGLGKMKVTGRINLCGIMLKL